MADNFDFLDALGNAKTARSEENGGVHTPGLVILDAAGNVWVAQQLAAASLPVVIASDQILATIGLNTQAGVVGNTDGSNNQHLRGINTTLNNRLPATIGQDDMAGSMSVAIASDQSPVPVSGTVTVNEPVTIEGTVTVNEPVTIDGTVAVSAIASTVTVQGVIQQDSPDDNTLNKPVKIGGGGSDTPPGAVSANGDMVNAWFDRNGRQAVFDDALAAILGTVGDAATITDTTGTIKSALRGLVKFFWERVGRLAKGSAVAITPSKAMDALRYNNSDADSTAEDSVRYTDDGTVINSVVAGTQKWGFATFTGGAPYRDYLIPMQHYDWPLFSLTNNLDEVIGVEIQGWLHGTDTQREVVLRGSINIATGGSTASWGVLPGGTGADASYYPVEAMRGGWHYLVLRVTPAAPPTTGQLTMLLSRSSRL